MDGHSGDIYNVAFHPTKPHILATVADSGHVHLWDCSIRQMTHCAVSEWTLICPMCEVSGPSHSLFSDQT